LSNFWALAIGAGAHQSDGRMPSSPVQTERNKMSLKAKAIGLGLLAALAASALAVATIQTTTNTPAYAETGGHFVTDDTSGHTILTGVEKSGNTGVFVDPHNNNAQISCKADVTYHGTITQQTVSEVTLTPTFPTGAEGCTTKISLGTFATTIDMNGCDLSFTIGKTHNQHNTTHIRCPIGKHVQATLSNGCIVTIKAQTPAGGSGYYNIPEKEITIKPTLTGIHAVYIGGPFKCGAAEGTTTNKIQFGNRISLKAFTTAGTQKSIAATGPEDN
jgi:hypothetical protein